MDVKTALHVLDGAKEFNDKVAESIGRAGNGGSTKKEKKFANAAKNLEKAIQERAGGFARPLTAQELRMVLTDHDMSRLELYGRNLCDHHLVADLVSAVSRLQFLGRLGGSDLSKVQSALMVGMGLQAKTVDDLAGELGLPGSQVLAMFNKAVRKMSQAIRRALEVEVRRSDSRSYEPRRHVWDAPTGSASTFIRHIPAVNSETSSNAINTTSHAKAGAGLAEKMDGRGAMEDVTRLTLAEDQEASAKDVVKAYDPNLDDDEIRRYHVRGTEEEWSSALESGLSPTGKLSVSVGKDSAEKEKEKNFKRSANYFEEEEERARGGVGKALPEKLRKEKRKRKKASRKVGNLGE